MSDAVSRRVASNTAVQIAGKGAVLLMAAASIAVLTRYLGPGDYGRFTLALMYVQLFAVLADAGLFMTVVRDISKRPERTEELVGNTLVLRGLLWFAVIALAGLVSLALPYSQDVRVAILLAGGPLLFGLLNTSLVAVFQARLRMGRAVISEVVGRAAGLALTISVAALDLGFYAVMGAAAGGALVSLVVTWLLARGMVPIRLRSRNRRSGGGCSGEHPAGTGACDQRALLPRRHADHLPLAFLRGSRPVHARVPHARVHAAARRGLPHHGVPGDVARRRRGRAPRSGDDPGRLGRDGRLRRAARRRRRRCWRPRSWR